MSPIATHPPAPAGAPAPARPVQYPDSDGLPMSDNTVQFQYIVSTVAGYQEMYAGRSDVLVAGDLLWYPVEGDNVTRTAPDTFIAFGRPPGPRGSYKQWAEGGIAPQVVFEILSPGNRLADRNRKLAFYERFGVEEYYEYDPDRGDLAGWHRVEGKLQPIPEMEGWVSPRTGVKFGLRDGMLELTRPDGKRFLTYDELIEQRMVAEAERQKAAAERQVAEAERHKAAAERQVAETERRKAAAERQIAEAERQKADAERLRAQEEWRRAESAVQRAETERLRAELEKERAERLAAKLRNLGIDPGETGAP